MTSNVKAHYGTLLGDYRTLRLAPDWVQAQVERAGFTIDSAQSENGRVNFIASRLQR